MNKNSVFQIAHPSWTYGMAASLALFVVMGPPREAAAGLLAYEGFQYVPAQTLPTMPGGIGWAPGPWTGSAQMVDQPPTLSYPTGAPSSGDALFNPVAGEAWRNFMVPLNNAANDIWLSFQEQSVGAAGGAFVDLLPTTGIDVAVNKASGGAITLNGLAAGFSAGPNNTDFFLLQIAKFSGGTTWVRLWVNPPAALGPPNAIFPIPSVFNLTQFYYRSDASQALDEIRVGTTPGDVAGAATGGGLGFTTAGGSLTLTWSQGTLLEAPTINGPWGTNNASSPYTPPMSAPQKFYRLIVQ